jgi:hypothetical protein
MMFPRTIESYKNRIDLLRSRGETVNAKLIKKLERQMRKLQES